MVEKPFVIKFGGSSVRYAFEEALELVKHVSEGRSVVVVVSALKGVTDELIRLAEGDMEALDRIREIHEPFCEELGINLDGLFRELELTLNQNFPTEECYRDAVVSFGERFSSVLFAEGLRLIGVEAKAIDSKDVLVARGSFGSAEVDMKASKGRISLLKKLLAKGVVPVVTGFYGDLNGFRATFGRGGSDYSATALASLLDAKAVVIMSDVEGIYTADPRIVPSAKLIPYLSYEEARTAARLGMKALHWRAIDPVENKIPVIFGKTKDWRFGTLVMEDSLRIPIVVHRNTQERAEVSIVGANAFYGPYKVIERGENFVRLEVPKDELTRAVREIHRMVVENESLRSGNYSELWARI
ncbi:aspartate kinase [Thermococcus chitonophagus]|uniref:Aspartokinase n=1 Tax=Thermococcus chitonophagus TaxID=54262 RepID=A0A160VVD7_9EURY|nr:aspartate kinase [Thermococcus chitonophagus]ASJ17088.1 aspartate kinase [Thermococcus chitonophagus]CUX77691.1 Aspartokinase [Thermococcus chitonophagus]